MNNKVIVCDLDGTLAPSKGVLEKSMSEIISKVLETNRFAVISGAGFEQFKLQFLSNLGSDSEKLKNLYLFPVNGSTHYQYDVSSNDWKEIYSEKLTDDEKKEIYDAFGQAITESGVDVYDPYGKVDILEDRGGQVTFSARGQDAPLDVKQAWDPDEGKRKKIVSILEKIIPGFEIKIGGATSIDITHKGINKAYAIRKIEDILGISKEDIIFIGDAIFPGGNDYSATETGVQCIKVSGPSETEDILLDIIK